MESSKKVAFFGAIYVVTMRMEVKFQISSPLKVELSGPSMSYICN